MNGKHTPTPWNDNGCAQISAPSDQMNDGYFVAEFFGPDRAANAAFTTLAVKNHDALVEALKNVIEAAERALGDHVAPHDCFATGPLTGNPIADLVACPGCVHVNEIASARAALAAAGVQS